MAALLAIPLLGAAGYFGYKEYQKTHPGATAPKLVDNPKDAFAQKPIAQAGGKKRRNTRKKHPRRHRK